MPVFWGEHLRENLPLSLVPIPIQPHCNNPVFKSIHCHSFSNRQANPMSQSTIASMQNTPCEPLLSSQQMAYVCLHHCHFSVNLTLKESRRIHFWNAIQAIWSINLLYWFKLLCISLCLDLEKLSSTNHNDSVL